MTLSVVIPAYNEADSIRHVVESVKKHAPHCDILVVDDGSTDETADRAAEAGARVIRHPYNIGNGAAVKTGIRNATGEKLLLLDGDGQHDPADIPKLLEKADRYDMVVGARDPQTHATVFRRLANAAYNLLASFITKVPVKDLTSGFRLMDTAIVTRYLFLLPNTFSYPTTITLAYLRSGRSIYYLPVQARRRTGRSKIRVVRDGIRFLVMIIKIATLFSPLHVFLPTSFLFFLLGLGLYVYTYLFYGRFTNMAALCLTTSVVLFMMGLISEQITQLRYDRLENGG